MNEQSSLSSSLSSHLGGQSTARSTASGGLEHDNSNLRRKLHELREEKSCLISENHCLVSEVEKVRFELHCAVGQLKPLQEAAESQRLRQEELKRCLVEAKASFELKEREKQEWENRCKNSSLQLIESNSLIQHQTEMLLSLKQELTDLSAAKKVTEADRDTALTGAEQMRQSFVDFQNRLQSRLRSAEDQLSGSYDEREKLLADLMGRCLEIESLQSVQEELGAEVATERSLRQSADTQNKELLARLRDCALQIEKLEAELKRCELLKNENHDLKVGLEEKSQKLKCYEGELRDYWMQLTDLESLAQNLQSNIVTSLKSCDRGEAVVVRRVVSSESTKADDGRRMEDAAFVEELRSKLALAEKELQQLRQKNANDNNSDDSRALNGAPCETENLGGVFQLESRISVDNWEASIQKLEEERQQQMASIATLERKIADLEVDKVSLEAQLTQRNSQIDDLQRDMQEQTVKAAMTERTLRRAALQTAALDRQLDEKSAQVMTLVSQVDDLEETLRAKSEELRKREELTERRVEEAIGSSEATKQISEKRCRELKSQLEMAESRHHGTLHQLEQTERRSMSLQQTLTDMNVVLNTLRQELQQSSTLLHEEKERSDRMVKQKNAASHQQEEALKAATAKLQAAEEQHHVEFSHMAKRVSDLEEELRKATEDVEEKDDRLEPLEKELKEMQAKLLESSAKVEELEGLKNAVRMEKEEMEQAVCQEMSGLKVLLESSEKKLYTAMADVERREQQARDLAATIRDLQLEKRQVIDELGNELKDTLKQLKNERRGNERLSADLASLQRETKQLTESLKERQELMESLQKKLNDRDAELQERAQATKDLFAECEKRKLEDETKDIRATELESRLRGRETELELSREQLESLRMEMRRCRDELRCRQNAVDELNQEREQHQWELQQRAAQVTQLDMAMKERLAESEQRAVRLEVALQKAQLEVHQQGQQSKDLAEQTKGLTAALRQKSHLVHELEQVVRQLKAELDAEKDRVVARGTEIEAMGLEREGLVLSKRRSQEELAKTSDQLQALQGRLDCCEQRLATTQAEFDRTTESLADTRSSFKSQKLELEKLLEALAKADKDRTRLSEHIKRSENEYCLVNDQLTRELARLRDTHGATQSGLEEELSTERQKRKVTEENQQQLILELKRMSQRASSLQMELDATRMIAGATKETSLIKDGEIARLKARISCISRSQMTAAMETCFDEPGHVTNGGCSQGQTDFSCLGVVSSCDVQEQRPLDGVDSQNARNSSCKAAAENSSQVGRGQLLAASSSKLLQTSGWESCAIFSTDSQLCKERSFSGDKLPCPSEVPPCIESCLGIDDDDNPDSLQAMWNQLQQGQTNTPPPSLTSTNSDRELLPYRSSSRATIGGATTSTGASDPRRCAAAAHCNDPIRSGANLEEKLRVQNRIKTLIGYKEPTRKTTTVSSLSSDSSSRSSVISRQTVTGGNWRKGDIASTAVPQFGRARNSMKRRIQDESQVRLREDTDCSSSTYISSSGPSRSASESIDFLADSLPWKRDNVFCQADRSDRRRQPAVDPDICAASSDRFAYCATLAVYIYQMDPKLHDFKLHSIMAEHKKTISTISWCPYDKDLIAVASITNRIIIWNVAEQRTVARVDVTTGTPRSIGWGVPDKHNVAFIGCRGPMQIWNYFMDGQMVVSHKEVQNFASDVCQFRLHPQQPEKVAVGHVDGSISFLCPGHRMAKHVVRVSGGVDEGPPNGDDGRIICLEWDPLGFDCVACITASDGMALVDSTSGRVAMRFQLPSAATSVCCLAWVHSAPGMFITGDANSGVLRLWNVSKATPIESIRVNKTGFHSLYVIICPTTTTTIADDEVSTNVGDFPVSEGRSSSFSPSSQFAIPSARVLCLFTDGGVGLYDLRRRRWNFLRENGHIETIFDCKFSPDDPDLLATASFDGTIKVWDIRTLKAISTSAGNEGVIYSLSWGPSETHCIAASTSRHGAFIWDTRKAKVVNRFSEHKPGANIYTIAWNQKDVRRIATAGSDCLCVVCHMDGKPIIKYSHPMAVYGCDWSPHNGDIVATGCEDKNVRVFYLATNSENPVKTYSGHTAKVFHVRWSPLREGILVSGSDDGSVSIPTLRVVHPLQISELEDLYFQGHTGPVRGLLWNPEIPYLLISGSWDNTIRIWDTRDGACVDRILDHGADVYGLSCHPKRPFVLASCSRDSTVRLWSLTSLVQPLEINVLAGRPWDEILVSPVTGKEHAMSLGTPPLLAGKRSRDIKLDLERSSGDAFKKSVALFSEFFGKPDGGANLWQLVGVCLGQDADVVVSSASYRRSIVHSTHVVPFKTAEAQELEMVRMSKFGSGLGAPSRDDRMREAAEIHLKLGNTRRYCQLLIELGEWDRALAVAPSVSLSYWKNLVLRRAKELMTDDSIDALPYAVAAHQPRLLVDFLTNRGQHHDAHLVAAAAAEGEAREDDEEEEDGDDEGPDDVRTNAARANRTRKMRTTEADELGRRSGKSECLLEKTTCYLADWYFHNGSPILAACCHLAVDDHQRAMSKLIRSSELELAAAIGQVLGSTEASLRLAVELLARRCERIGYWELGVRLLRRFKGMDLALAKLCARCAAPMAEINDLHRLAGLPTMEECGVKAEGLRSATDKNNQEEEEEEEEEEVKCGQGIDCLMYYMLSTTPETGLQLGIDTVKGRMSKSGWTVDDVFEMLQMVASMQTERLQKQTTKMSELLVLCAYVGALVAIRRRYDSVVLPLFRHALVLLKRDHLDDDKGRDFPFSQSLLSKEMTICEATHLCGKSRSSLVSAEQQSSYDDLMGKVEEGKSSSSAPPPPIELGPDVVLGSNLPNHSDVNVSCLSNQRIQGPVFFLEDGFSALSLSDAYMWAKVNPFSPLGSGMRINPF